MSPGDVESISEGDIPEAEGGLSPGHDDTGEPFEPILSDESIADDGDHQDMDYDFGDYSEDPLKSFNPYSNEIQPLQNLPDPTITSYELEKLRGTKNKPDGAATILSILESIPSPAASKEVWVESVEQLLNIIPNSLLSVDDTGRTVVIEKLIEWTCFGLNFTEAVTQPQPAFKLRHIKAGVRLVETLSQISEEICLKIVKESEAQIRLLDLHEEEYMALSIKLMILRSLDATLCCSSTVKQFLFEGKSNGNSGYQRLVRMIEEKNHARVKYAMCAIVSKLHFYDLLSKHHSFVLELQKDKPDNEECFESLANTLENVLQVFIDAPRILSQPKRFLPVSAQFEIGNCLSDPYKALFSFFRDSCILDDFISILSHQSASCHPLILAPVNGLISQLLETNDGLKFLLSFKDINKLIRLLLGSPSSGENEIGRAGVNPTLGLHAAYRLQALSYIDNLTPLSATDPDKPEVLDILHGMFNLTLSNVANIGKSSVVHVLSQNGNIDILLDMLKHKSALRKRSPSRGYICDLIILTVKLSSNMPFFQKYVEKFVSLIPEFPELNEIQNWLKPLENPCAFSYDNIAPVCEFIKNNIENSTNLPGDLIMAVRILRFLGIPKHDRDLSPIPVSQEYSELKFKCVILQLYSLDGIAHLTSILQKLAEHYVQPALHSSSLIGRQGLLLLAFIHPSIQLMRRMLTYVISVRNTEFKDLSAIPVLLNIYNLMQSVPINAQAHTDALRVCHEIVETLLAYTQPVSSETSTESDALNKSLWTSMVMEVIKFSSTTPYNFISGLMVFSELLPLPLPLQTRKALTQDEVSRFVSARKLWSAHLHSLNSSIENMIRTLGVSSQHPLLQILRRVCLQLADLAAPSALMVVRTLLDSIQSQIQNDIKNPLLARLLNFLSCLMAHGPVKAAFLSLIKGKDEKYPNLLTNLINLFKSPSDLSVQSKEYFALVVQTLCDSEISLVPPSSNSNSITNEMFLANALPSKDLLTSLCNAMLEHVSAQDHSLASIFHVLRTFVLLTEHYYSFYHFKVCLSKKPDAIIRVFEKISEEWSKDNHDSLAGLGILLQLCRAVDSSRGGDPLTEFLMWNPDDHPLLKIDSALKKSVLEDESLEPLSDEVSSLIKLLKEESENKTDQKELTELVLPSPESLLSQFSLRQVWLMVDTDDDRLTSAYWLSPPNLLDIDPSDPGQVSVDLIEIAKMELPELNLSDAIARLCRTTCPVPGEIPVVREAKKRNFEHSGAKRPFVAVMRGRGFRRGDMFRSRPPNTSRPPSLHVDDFVALETCGAQPTGPTGYNKASMRAAQDLIVNRARGRGRTFGGERGGGRFFGAATTYQREAPGDRLWGEAVETERRGGGAWGKDGRASRARNLRFFSR